MLNRASIPQSNPRFSGEYSSSHFSVLAKDGFNAAAGPSLKDGFNAKASIVRDPYLPKNNLLHGHTLDGDVYKVSIQVQPGETNLKTIEHLLQDPKVRPYMVDIIA